SLWARARVDALMDEDWRGMQQGQPRADIKQAITNLGVTFHLMTQFTSFVAVEEKIINQGGQTQRVDVPVEMTDGVSYEGVFGEKDARLCAKGVAHAPAAACAPTVRGITTDAACEARPARAPSLAAGGLVKERVSPQERLDNNSAVPVAHPKLDAALHGLETKVVNGSYRQGVVKVENGYVTVVIRVNDLSSENVARLKQLGVRIVSQVASSKRIMAQVRIQDLVALCNLDFVTRIEPPSS
ncbi:MAG: hypothetical protein NTU83_06855, partial [Candidatus Hydrogenedentes bacterium]|nr:hypothetical protein [Candidatus Hydrogenedentota bacterium]